MTKRRPQNQKTSQKKPKNQTTPQKKNKNQKAQNKTTQPKIQPKPYPSSKTAKNKSNMQTVAKLFNPKFVFSLNYELYYQKIITNIFESYAQDILEGLITEEVNKERRNIITPEILEKFGINNNVRKYCLKYLYKTLSLYKIDNKYYFKSVAIFDCFLINYADQKPTDECLKFFFSKKTNQFSDTKLILFSLCCFYIANQILNTSNFDLKCLINWDEKDELSYTELIELVDDILIVIDCDTNKISLFDFIELLLFDITKRIKILGKEETFSKKYREYILYLAIKFSQDISFLNILPSTQALGIFAFSYEYTKYVLKNVDDEICLLVENWARKVKNFLPNCFIEDINNMIMWLNDYVNKHEME